MYLKKNKTIVPEKFPTHDHYQFDPEIFHQTPRIEFNAIITYFVGENGSVKSTLFEAICKNAA